MAELLLGQHFANSVILKDRYVDVDLAWEEPLLNLASWSQPFQLLQLFQCLQKGPNSAPVVGAFLHMFTHALEQPF